MVVLFEICVK